MRRSILWFCIAVTALIVLLLWQKEKPTESSPPVSIQTNATLPASITAGAPANASIQTNAPIARVSPNNAIPEPPLKTKEQEMREGLANYNDVDIEFYGRLEDQFGDAVGNAQLKIEIPFNNGHAVGVNRTTMMADANGLFTIKGYKGESLSVVPVKSGYVLASLNGGGVYSYLWPDSQRVHPDPNNPVIMKMWKLQGAEPLVSIDKEYRLPFTNTPIFFDLVAGGVVPSGGDLQVVITRASGPLSKKNPGDWSIDLKSISGGIIESDYRTAQITFEAPADDYQDSYFVQMKQDDPAWSDGIDKEFFFKSRDGQVYGKFYLDFGINRDPNDPLYFQFKGVANTNSSRNWEATAPK